MRGWICPVSDHDGARVPVTRHVDATRDRATSGAIRLEGAWCEYCAEGKVARLVREGWRVTVWAVPPVELGDEACGIETGAGPCDRAKDHPGGDHLAAEGAPR